MSSRQYELDGIGTITLHKRRGARNIRLSITHDGRVRITLPMWAPYKLGSAFAEQKRLWLLARLPTNPPLKNRSRIGKAHTLAFGYKPIKTVGSRVANNTISITMPIGWQSDNQAVQDIARRASVRALKKEAKQLLPKRLDELAARHGFRYRSIKVKELRGRWGSCSQHKDVVLNCYLMQLPWELIDYVILHELLHTRVLAHGRPFWTELEQYVPNLKTVRKTMRSMQPTLHARS